MPNVSKGSLRERVDFSKIQTSIPIPNLIEVQKRSYERFLQMDLLPKEREDGGLQSVFSSVFPISDFASVALLEFVRYEFEPPKYDVDECRQRGGSDGWPFTTVMGTGNMNCVPGRRPSTPS